MANEMIDIIRAAAQRHGVDPNVLVAQGRIESSLNPALRNSRSSAGGLFQFIDSTAKQYGLTDRYDPAAASDAAARLMRDNRDSLARSLGRAPSPGELYLAHQQGAGGAAKLLMNPNALASDLVGSAAAGLNGGRAGMTGAQFAQMWDQRLGRAMGQTGGGGEAPSIASAFGQPAMALGQPAPMEAQAPNPLALAASFANDDMASNQAAAAAKRESEMTRKRALFA